MKSLIVYYSYSGNTKRVAQILADELAKKGAVDILQLKPEDEIKSFFAQCLAAFSKRRAKLGSEVNFDLVGYDLICLGTPVWAFAPTPAINSYLDRLTNAADKKAIVFTTYGSGTGVKRCLKNMGAALKQKGIGEIKEFNIQQFKVNNRDFVIKAVNEAMSFLD